MNHFNPELRCYVNCTDIEIPSFRSLLNIEPHINNVRFLLRESMKKYGLYQPIIVRVSQEIPGKYELIDGYERLEAAKNLGWTSIETYVFDYISDADAIYMYLTIEFQKR